MKANGASGSLAVFRQVEMHPPDQVPGRVQPLQEALQVRPGGSQRRTATPRRSRPTAARSTSGVRYSAPAIMGAVSTSVASSPSAGAAHSGTHGRRRSPDDAGRAPPRSARRSSRHQPKAGGRACPTSPGAELQQPMPGALGERLADARRRRLVHRQRVGASSLQDVRAASDEGRDGNRSWTATSRLHVPRWASPQHLPPARVPHYRS